MSARKRSLSVPLCGLSLLALALLLQAGAKWGFGEWRRLSNDPIITPQGYGWESAGTFNPAVVFHEGRFVMLYRAQDAKGTSRLGYAESGDGIHFKRRREPVLSPETDYEKDGGVEDPRLVKIDGTYYLTYTGYNKKDAQLCLANSKDLVRRRCGSGRIDRSRNPRWDLAGAPGDRAELRCPGCRRLHV